MSNFDFECSYIEWICDNQLKLRELPEEEVVTIQLTEDEEEDWDENVIFNKLVAHLEQEYGFSVKRFDYLHI